MDVKIDKIEVQIKQSSIIAIRVTGHVTRDDIFIVHVSIKRDALGEIITGEDEVVDRKYYVTFTDLEELKRADIKCGNSIHCRASTQTDEVGDSFDTEIECNDRTDGIVIIKTDDTDSTSDKLPSACNEESDDSHICADPVGNPEAYIINFNHYIEVNEIDLINRNPDEKPTASLSIGTSEIKPKYLTARSAAQIRYRQSWKYENIVISDVASTIGLGPGERLTLSMKTKDSRKWSKKVEESEDISRSHSTDVGEKDIFRLARETTENESWNFNAKLGVDLGIVSLGFGGGGGGSIQKSAKSAIEKISNVTQKSANTLKLTQKLEVKEESEISAEAASTRLLINPLPDQTLWLKVFEQRKQYTATTEIESCHPVLLLSLQDFPFDDQFIYSNGDFLEKHLKDKVLLEALREYLSNVDQDGGISYITQAERDEAETIATIALKYLYENPPNIFNMPPITNEPGLPPLPDGVRKVLKLKSNTPHIGLDASMDWNAITDGRINELGKAVTILAFYYKLYKAVLDRGEADTQGLPQNIPKNFIIEIALAMEASLQPEWDGKDGMQENIKHVIDNANLTEIFRRLSGFLSLVRYVLRPKVRRSMGEDSLEENKMRNNVISRVLQHIDYHKDYYINTYITYLWTNGFTNLLQKATGDFLQLSGGQIQNVDNKYDISSLTVDNGIIVIPYNSLQCEDIFDTEIVGQLMAVKPEQQCIELPCEGSYIAAQKGKCDPLELPEDKPIDASANISIKRD